MTGPGEAALRGATGSTIRHRQSSCGEASSCADDIDRAVRQKACLANGKVRVTGTQVRENRLADDLPARGIRIRSLSEPRWVIRPAAQRTFDDRTAFAFQGRPTSIGHRDISSVRHPRPVRGRCGVRPTQLRYGSLCSLIFVGVTIIVESTR